MLSDNLILVDKPYGATPLETIHALRRLGIVGKNEKATYAGRLDPLATGLLLVLRGESVHEKEKYLTLEKTYEIHIAFGILTDTGDILGMPILSSKLSSSPAAPPDTAIPTLKQIKEVLESITEIPYPKFSSKTVTGKPLHEYGREGIQVPRPSRPMRFTVTHASETPAQTSKSMLTQVATACELVKGDFRQLEILNAWKALQLPESLAQYSLTIRVTSGTYMRAIPEILKQAFGIDSVVTKIHRTQVGEYAITDQVYAL